MLLPCGIDVFSGVEFVCCPAKKVRKGRKRFNDTLFVSIGVSVSVFTAFSFISFSISIQESKLTRGKLHGLRLIYS